MRRLFIERLGAGRVARAMAGAAGMVTLGAMLALAGCTAAPPSGPRPVAGTDTRLQPELTPSDSAHRPSKPADDPTVTDPDKYHLVMENDRVRVLRYHDEPGARTHQHAHPDAVLHALSSFRRRLTFPDGTSKEREFQIGDVMWIPAQTHVGENIGTTHTDVLLVELKPR